MNALEARKLAKENHDRFAENQLTSMRESIKIAVMSGDTDVIFESRKIYDFPVRELQKEGYKIHSNSQYNIRISW